MSRRPARCTEADLKRALKVADLGKTPRTVEVAPDGTIRIIPAIHRKEDDGPDDDEVIVL